MSAPLRVALIASNRFPLCQPFAGGLEAHVWHLARALVERGHEVSLFAGSGSDLSLDCAALPYESCCFLLRHRRIRRYLRRRSCPITMPI